MTAPQPGPGSTSALSRRAPIPFRGRTTLLTLVVPAAITTAALAIAWAWRDDLPDPIAIHWGTHGPDGSGSLLLNVVVLAVVSMVAAGLLWALSFFAGRQSFLRRGAAGLSVWFVTVLEGVSTGGLSVQRGVTNWRDAGSIGGPMLVVFIVAAVATSLVIVLSPGDPPLPTIQPIPRSAPRLSISDSEQASWIREVFSPGYRVTLWSTVIAVAVVGILVGYWAITLAVGIVLGLAFVLFMHWVVTVNEDGLTVRSVLGRPRFRVPLDEVIEAKEVEVRPIAEFGGFGVRGDKRGRIGVIVRKGPAIEVHRTGDRIFIVTVDDAATAAALLNTLAGRTRA